MEVDNVGRVSPKEGPAPFEPSPKEGPALFEPCTVCHLLITGTIWQCESGHLVCDQCKWRLLHEEVETVKCPTCRLCTTFDARNRERVSTLFLLKTRVHTGALESIGDTQTFVCPYDCCDTKRLRPELDVHVDTCPKRTFPCIHSGTNCDFRGTLAQVTEHMRTSEKVQELKSDADGKIVVSIAIPTLGELRTDRIEFMTLWEAVPAEHTLLVHFVLSRVRLFVGLFAIAARPVAGYEMVLEHASSGTRLQSLVVFDSLDHSKQCFPALALGGSTLDAITDKAGPLTLTFYRHRSSKKRKFDSDDTGPPTAP
jgi:hypothetical protein